MGNTPNTPAQAAAEAHIASVASEPGFVIQAGPKPDTLRTRVPETPPEWLVKGLTETVLVKNDDLYGTATDGQSYPTVAEARKSEHASMMRKALDYLASKGQLPTGFVTATLIEAVDDGFRFAVTIRPKRERKSKDAATTEAVAETTDDTTAEPVTEAATAE